jgi:hypothetical protein
MSSFPYFTWLHFDHFIQNPTKGLRSKLIISHVKIIAFQLSLFCKKYHFSKTVLYIINRKIHECLEIPDLFLVLNMISHSFAALTREISCAHSWDITQNKSGISAHPCIILYIIYLPYLEHLFWPFIFVVFGNLMHGLDFC